MKIAIIVWTLNVKGGTQRQAIFLSQKLQEYGHEVALYTGFYYPEECYVALLNNKKVKFLFKCKAGKEERFFNIPPFIEKIKILRSLIRKVKENKMCQDLAGLIDNDTEILNPHDQYVYKVGYYFKKRKNIPSIWMANDIPSRQWLADKMHEIGSKSVPKFKKFLYSIVDTYEKKFIKAQDKIVVLDKLNKYAVKKYFNLDSKIIRSGLDLERFANSMPKKRQSQQTQLLMVGVLFPHRRYEDGVNAVKLLKDWGYNISLKIIGSDVFDKNYKAKLETLVKDLNLRETVNFLGAVNEKDLLRAYSESDILVFPNHLQTWGLVVFEAMACGLPVIVSRTSGASEVLKDGENAILIEPKNPLAIAKAVKKLIDDRLFYKKLRSNGFKFVQENISWDRYAREMLNIFHKLSNN